MTLHITGTLYYCIQYSIKNYQGKEDRQADSFKTALLHFLFEPGQSCGLVEETKTFRKIGNIGLRALYYNTGKEINY